MKRALTAIVLIPLVLVVLFVAPMWLFSLVVGMFAMGAAYEYLNLVDCYVGKSSKSIPLIFVASIFLLVAVNRSQLYSPAQPGSLLMAEATAILMGAGPLVVVAFALCKEDLKNGVMHAVLSAFVFPYIVLSLMSLIPIRMR